MSKTYTLKSVQTLPCSIDQAWEFFSNPKNLFTITPAYLNLKVTSNIENQEIFEGQEIRYTVKPLFGIPMSWQTRITEVKPQRLFVDEQEKGPYKLWRHQHFFNPIEGGVEMADLVHYQVPFSLLGSLANKFTIRKKLRQIFTYRYFKVNQLFGSWPGATIDLQIE
ncbi:MAG TPA: SRPBCC family protein [Chitinophagaceae bacterium]|nr:SRPBCC family protein [Chitinophagaceae bacterium]